MYSFDSLIVGILLLVIATCFCRDICLFGNKGASSSPFRASINASVIGRTTLTILWLTAFLMVTNGQFIFAPHAERTPSAAPSTLPSQCPTVAPTNSPSFQPSFLPTRTKTPTFNPSSPPTRTNTPSFEPSFVPTLSMPSNVKPTKDAVADASVNEGQDDQTNDGSISAEKNDNGLQYLSLMGLLAVVVVVAAFVLAARKKTKDTANLVSNDVPATSDDMEDKVMSLNALMVLEPPVDDFVDHD